MTYRSISLLLLFCLLLTGCTAKNEPVPVTDEETRAALWEDYLAETIGSIDKEAFSAPAQAQDLWPFLYYTLAQMTADGQLTVNDKQLTLPPWPVMAEQLERYFGTDLGLTAETYAALAAEHTGDTERGTLYFSPHSVSYADSLTDDHRLGEVTYTEATQTYQAAVTHIANADTGRVDLIRLFTLKERDNGELYFVSQEWQYPPLPDGLVELTGDFQELSGLRSALDELSLGQYPEYVAGEWQGHLLLFISAFTDQMPYRDHYLLLYAPEQDRVLAEYAFTETTEHVYSGLRLMGDRLLLRFTDGYTYLDGALTPLGELKPLPEAVRAAVNFDHEWSGCYEVSDDERTFYYLQDAQELWQYDTATQTEKPLFRRADLDYSGNYGLFDLQLLPAEQTLIMKLAGYGGPIGQYAISLDAPENGRQYRTHFELKQNWTNDGCPLPEVDYHTLLDGGAYEWTQLPVDGTDPLSFIVPVTAEQQFGQVSLGDYLLYNDRCAVYTNCSASGRHPEDSVYHLIRVDLKTHTAQTLLTSQAAAIEPIAILPDGRVLFRYNFEKLQGFGLTQ